MDRIALAQYPRCPLTDRSYIASKLPKARIICFRFRSNQNVDPFKSRQKPDPGELT